MSIRILFAIGHKGAEEYLSNLLSDEYEVVSICLYKSAVLKNIENTRPEIAVISEGLEGKENIWDILKQIKIEFPDVRIVFISGDRKPGDKSLEWLVNKGIFDIVYGESVNINKVYDRIKNPNTFKDVQYLQRDIDGTLPEVVPTMTANKPVEDTKEPETDIDEDDEDDKTIVLSKDDIEKGLLDSPVIQAEENIDYSDEPAKIDPEMLPVIDKKKEIENKKVLTKTPIRIISVFGAVEGIGTSSVALNIANTMAMDGLKTVLIDFHIPATKLYRRTKEENPKLGIDDFILSIKKGKPDLRNTTVNSSSGLAQNKKLNTNLFIMSYSKKYIKKRIPELNGLDDKNLSIILKSFVGNGFNVVMSIPGSTEPSKMASAIKYSNSVFYVTTQDAYSISNTSGLINTLVNNRINAIEKASLIVNKYEKIYPKDKDLSNIFPIKRIFTIKNDNKGFIKSGHAGMPYTSVIRSNVSKTYYSIVNLVERGDI